MEQMTIWLSPSSLKNSFCGWNRFVEELVFRPVNDYKLELAIGSRSSNGDGWRHKYKLCPKEFQVLYKLVGHPNKIFTRLDLLDSIWGIETDHDERVVDACIKSVRKKILPYSQVSIETVRGLGYKALVREEKLDG